MIPLSEPFLGGNEWAYLKQCLDTNWVSSAGSFVEAFERIVATYSGAGHAVAVNSGTSALHLALLLARVQANELVLLPNLTFVATANAVRYVGAQPVLIDVRPDDWQMDLDLVEEFLDKSCELQEGSCMHLPSGKRVAALLPVHVLGGMADMDRLLAIAQGWQLPLIEDAAEAVGSRWKDQHAGTLGTLGCLSFNGNKIITTGGGGMLLCRDEDLARRARHLASQAKVPGSPYYHDCTGYNYRLPNLLAALGVAQMEQLDSLLRKRQQLATTYREQLPGVQFQKTHPFCRPNHWLTTIYTHRKEAILQFLQARHIQARSLWTPIKQLPMYQECLYISRENHSQHLFEHCLSLPSSASLTETDQLRVIEAIKAALLRFSA